MKPTLVLINFPENRARRYVPKILGGFFTEEAKIGDEKVPAVTQSWGDEEGRRLIESFRLGKEKGQNVVIEEEIA